MTATKPIMRKAVRHYTLDASENKHTLLHLLVSNTYWYLCDSWVYALPLVNNRLTIYW
jgi:hypothetical protein